MRFLLHDSQAVYSATDKKWYFTLDRRIENPTHVRIGKCSFTAATASTYPAVVYMRSNALFELSAIKHTVELKSVNHHDSSNVIAVLHETHQKGRYSGGGLSFPVHGHTNHTIIDIYFTDGGTILDGAVSTTAQVTSSGEDADVLAIGADLICWTDLDFTRCFDANFVATTAIGDPVNYVYDRHNPDVIWALVYGNNMVLAQLGATNALYRAGSWQSIADSSIPAGTMQDEFQLHFLFQQNAINDYVMLFYFAAMKILMYQGSLSSQAGNTITALPGITIVPLQGYLVSVTRQLTNNVANFVYRVERLSDNSVQTSTSGDMGAVPTGNTVWRLGVPNTSFSQYQGPFIICNTTSTSHAAACQAWLRNTYAGTVVQAGEEEATTSEPASFFANLNIAQSQRGK